MSDAEDKKVVINKSGKKQNQPEQIDGALVFRTPSNSRAGQFHFTIIAPGGFRMCSCEGFRYHKDCYHLTYAYEVLS